MSIKKEKIINLNSVGVQPSNINSIQFSLSLEYYDYE